MIRDLRLLHDRRNVNPENYKQEVQQEVSETHLLSDGVKFENCIDHLEGEISYRSGEPSRYEEYLAERKEASNGNLWKFLGEVRRLYDSNDLDRRAREWNLKLLERSQEGWFQWVAEISYPGIQDCCLYYAPSLDCLIDFLKFIRTDLETKKENMSESQLVLVMLILHRFCSHMTTIEEHMAYDNRGDLTLKKWNMDQWKEAESIDYLKRVFRELLEVPFETVINILYQILSHEWIYEKRTIRGKCRERFRNTLLEEIADRYENKLPQIIESELWEPSEAALHHRMAFYYYWSKGLESKDLEQIRCLQNTLWEAWKSTVKSDKYLVPRLYDSEDGFWFLWLSGHLMSDDEDMMQRLKIMLGEFNKRSDGWNYQYDKSRCASNIVCSILTIAAMAAEWKSKTPEGLEIAEQFYWNVFEFTSQFIRGNRYDTNVMKYSLLQIWSRMTVLSRQNPFAEKEDLLWKSMQDIDRYDYRVYVLDNLMHNIEYRNLNWDFGEQLKSRILNILRDEKEILDQEKIANPTYYKKFYMGEDRALNRCLEKLM